MAQWFSDKDKMAEQGASPIVNNSKLPTMDGIEKLGVEKSSLAGKNEMQTSLESRKKVQSPKSNQKGNFMKPFKSPDKKEKYKEEVQSENLFEPQKEASAPRKKEDQEEGYIRLQLRVENGEIWIIGVRAVESSLLQEESVHGGELGYEIRLADQRLALGSIPDFGEMRGFPPPHPTEDMHGHQIIKQLENKFTVRILRKHFTEDNAKRLEISVFRIKGDVDFKCLSPDKSVLVQSDNLRNIAHLKGVTEKYTTKEALNQIDTIMRR